MNLIVPARNGISRRNFLKNTALTAGAVFLLSRGRGLAQQIYSSNPPPCNASRTWTGTKTTKQKFYVLEKEILTELRISFDEMLGTLANTANLIQQLSPFSGLSGIWALIKALDSGDLGTPETQQLIEQAKQWLEDNIWGAIEDNVNTLLGLNEEQIWEGTATQLQRTLSAPTITGPERVVEDTIGAGFTAKGISIQGTAKRMLEITISPRIPAQCGFGFPDGPRSESCACEGGQTTIADLPMKRAEYEISLNFIGFTYSGVGSAERVGKVVVIEVSGS